MRVFDQLISQDPGSRYQLRDGEWSAILLFLASAKVWKVCHASAEGRFTPEGWRFPDACLASKITLSRKARALERVRCQNYQVSWGVRMVRPEGLEPPTLGSEDRCSIQLSYGRRRSCLYTSHQCSRQPIPHLLRCSPPVIVSLYLFPRHGIN